jgi:hypothetical protein
MKIMIWEKRNLGKLKKRKKRNNKKKEKIK